MDPESRQAFLNLRAESVVTNLTDNPEGLDSIWHPEYAKFMLECTYMLYCGLY